MKLFLYTVFLVLIFSCRKKDKTVQWHTMNTGYTNELMDVHFLNDQIGYMVGGEQYDSHIIMKTTNGGKTWETSEGSSGSPLQSMQLMRIKSLPTGELYICGESGKLLFSQDSGSTWAEFQNQTWLLFSDIQYLVPDSGIAVGVSNNTGKIVKLNYFGEYTNIVNLNLPLYSLYSISSQKQVAGGSGEIVYSDDSGYQWYASDAKGDKFVSIVGMNDGTLYAFGYFGTVLTSDDEGHSWTKVRQAKPNGGGLFGLRKGIVLKDNSQMAIGDRGLIAVSSDGWKHYKYLSLGIKNNLFGIAQKPDGAIVICGSNGIALTIENY